MINAKRTHKIRWQNNARIISIEKNYNIIILTTLIGFGIIVGALIISKASLNLSGSISVIYGNYVSAIREKSFWTNLTDTFFTSIIYLVLIFIMGTNAVGIPFIYFITCIKGISIGIINGYLYASFGFKGVGFSTLVLFPYALISGVIIILAGDSAIKLSRGIFLDLINKGSTAREITIKKYCINFVIYTAFFIIASVIDAIFKLSFSEIFNI